MGHSVTMPEEQRACRLETGMFTFFVDVGSLGLGLERFEQMGKPGELRKSNPELDIMRSQRLEP